MPLTAGTRLGAYEIVSALGAGGMGEIYRARDARLGREVAIKVLPQELSRDAEALARFEREARAAAALSHPNVVGIHDFATEAGTSYAVLELLEGETFREWFAAGPPPTRKVAEAMAQVARGLAAAHAKGIVHRDLKPENLFRTTDGCAKVLDFGLAKISVTEPAASATEPMGTRPGTILGTVAYMSPEQVRGLAADARSDVFAFGAILFEALSGCRPFAGDSSAETMTAILRDEPPPLLERSAAAEPLERIARRCLEKNPEDRFQLARDLGFALEAYCGPVASAPTVRSSPESRRSLAVLPFKDLSRDPANAHLGIGLADATITELALVKSLLVRPTAAILSYQGRSVSPEEAGRQLDVEAVVDASFQRSGSKLRVTVQLVRTAGGQSLWGAKIDTSLDDIFEMQDQVSRRITEALEIQLTPADERRLRRGAQPAGGAYELCMKGRVHLLRETLTDVNLATDYFEKARALDPGSALPLVGLAEAYARMAFAFDPEGDWYDRAVAATDQALAIDPNLPEGRLMRGRLLWTPQRGFDHAGALREGAAVIAARPNLNEAHSALGLILLHLAMPDEAAQEFEQSLAILPGDPYATAHLELTRYLQGRWAELLQVWTAPDYRLPETPAARYQLAHAQIRAGGREAAARTLDAASRRFLQEVRFHPVRAILAALEGDRAEAHRQIDLTVQNLRAFGHYHHAQYDAACAYALLGEREAALKWLEDAARNGFPCHSFFEIDPLLAPIRSEARFEELMRELRAECDGYRALWKSLRSGSSAGSRPAAV